MSNRSVKLFRIWICGSGAWRCHLKIFLSRAIAAFFVWRSRERNHLCNFSRGSVKLFLIWTSGSGDVI